MAPAGVLWPAGRLVAGSAPQPGIAGEPIVAVVGVTVAAIGAVPSRGVLFAVRRAFVVCGTLLVLPCFAHEKLRTTPQC